METVGRGLKVDIDYFNLVGSGEVPRLKVELNLEMKDIPKLIEGCDVISHPNYAQKYRIIIEEVKLMEDMKDNITEELYDVNKGDIKRFKKIAGEELKKKGY